MTSTALTAVRVKNGTKPPSKALPICPTPVPGMAVELNTAETGAPPQTPEDGYTGGATSTPPVQKLANGPALRGLRGLVP